MNRKCEIIMTACISVSYAVKAVSKMNFFKIITIHKHKTLHIMKPASALSSLQVFNARDD